MKLPYDPVEDLAPITMGLNFPNVLVVNTQLAAETLVDYIASESATWNKVEEERRSAHGSTTRRAQLAARAAAGLDRQEVAPKVIRTYGNAMPGLDSSRALPACT